MLDGFYESLSSHLIRGRAEELLHVAHPKLHNGSVCHLPAGTSYNSCRAHAKHTELI